MNIFYTTQIDGNRAFLDENESNHAVRVLRMKAGERAILVDGKGNRYEAVIEESHPKHCTFGIENVAIDNPRPYRLSIAMAPTKNSERTEWFLEKAVEIGVDDFVPILSRHSERKNINMERLQKVALAAMKQSMKATLPEIAQIIAFESLIEKPFDGKKLIAHCYSGAKPHIKEVVAPSENAIVLIGPEGDFSEEEIALAQKHGFQDISLGQSRLRTETAALTACAVLAFVNS
ncbi:MAG: 16S rRNA (uracil(1498)-N(3))-methyltransferase [Prolixibacteraceae bacterium]|nr:16S rRNA (uracil(1498)-N(3))-methyltransferase [Prolixibacteraceae bacterium]